MPGVVNCGIVLEARVDLTLWEKVFQLDTDVERTLTALVMPESDSSALLIDPH